MLARHGETDYNRAGRWQGATDVPLNEAGRAQAVELAERVRHLPVTDVFSSDLSRATETAKIVAAALLAPYSGAIAALRERSFGVFEGLTRQECEARYEVAWRAYVADFRAAPPEAESTEEVIARMSQGLARVAARTRSCSLVVGHGASMRMFLGTLGVSPPPLANGAAFVLELAEGEIVRAQSLA